MTNATAIGSDIPASDKAKRRLRKRYAFETRFRRLGILALCVAGFALVSLLWTVAKKAVGALTETYIVLEVKPEAAEIDPKGSGDPVVIRRGDFSSVVKSALREEFPGVKDRSSKRELYRLVSDAGALELREAVMANPALLDQKQKFQLLASDDVNLWNSGDIGRIEPLAAVGRATPLGIEGDVKVVIESNSFGPLLLAVKVQLREKAKSFQKQADAQYRGVTVYKQRAEALGDSNPELRAKYEQQIRAYEAHRTSFIEKRDAILARANATGGTEVIDSDLPSYFVEINGGVVKVTSVSTDVIEGPVLLPLSSTTTAVEGGWRLIRISTSEAARKISDRQIALVERLRQEGAIEESFNWRFFTSTDSREAEIAGIWSAAVGSFWTMIVTFALAFPIGVMSAIYLEEFAPKNRITDFIEININNLAAVPSIVFGLLGLAVFINFFGVPRSAPLAGGMVLALMTLPTIIIAARAAIKAVPPSIRDAALGVGASNLQATTHHVLPLAMPGILTGTIIGMAQALGETAPLLMIGMVAFIVDVPTSVLDPATALPVQIFRWSDFPERAFELKTAAAIAVLLGFLIVMNILVVILRRRFERRW